MTLMFLHAVHLSSRVFFVIFKYKAANLPIHASVWDFCTMQPAKTLAL